MDLFGQIYLLDEGAALGRFITHYRTQYFYPSGFGGYDWTPQPGAAQRIGERMAPLVQVVEQKGNIDLPELVINDIWVDLPPAARTLYTQMEGAMLALVESGAVVAANAAVASSKCRQIANGCLFHTDVPGEYSLIHEAKVEALKELLEQLAGDPLLVTYEFVPDKERLEDDLKIPCISSGSAKRDNENIQKFARGELPVVMGQPQSVSLGIDGLQDSCHNIAMFGVPWSFLNYEQVIDRVRRVGNKSGSVTLHRILARDTVDERVIEVLDGRERGQEQFLTLLLSMTPNRAKLSPPLLA
jgi:SNF2 family DNA or RNA helicase